MDSACDEPKETSHEWPSDAGQGGRTCRSRSRCGCSWRRQARAAAQAVADQLAVCKNENVGTQARIEACTRASDRARTTTTSCTEALLQRGVLYEFAGDKEAAIKDYSEVIKLDPTSAVAYFNRGNVYDQMGEHDRAIADYSEAIKLDPSDPDIFNNRGQAYDAKGESRLGDRRLLAVDPSQPRQFARLLQPRPGLRQQVPTTSGPSPISTRRSSSIRAMPRPM